MDQVQLNFTEEALESIAALAIERNTGARGLRSIMENMMLPIMYKVPSHNDLSEVIIDADCVKGLGEPKYVQKELIQMETPAVAEASKNKE